MTMRMSERSVSRRHCLWILSAAAAPIAACARDASSFTATGKSDIAGAQEDAGDNAGPGGSGMVEDDGAVADASEPELPPLASQPGFSFVHGIASGDPLADRVILWTRVTPDDARLTPGTEILVDFVVASDPYLKTVIGKGRASTSSNRDYTVKVDVDGLSAGTTYYYQFFDPAQPLVTSATGRTRTLPVGALERARFAVVSCSCYALGFFNVYAHVAARQDIQAVIHLGDYIYEYGPENYNNRDLGRAHEPARELLTLDDYRTRHKQYKTDPDLTEAHRQHPFITIWDDHEVANDSWKGGAQNHTAISEGPYADRKAGAYRAYHEWMPIRDLDPRDDTKIYRGFAYGDLCDLVMLETRANRDSQSRAQTNSASRKLMSNEQASWLEGQLSASKRRGTTWRLLGQQVMMGQLRIPGVNIPNPDQWDGYNAQRERLLNYVEEEGIDNLVVLTGDIHSSWAIEVAKDLNMYDSTTGAGALAVEYVCSSVTSPALSFLSGALSSVVLSLNKHMKWVDLERRGYLLLDVDHTRVQGDWYHTQTILEPNANHIFAKAFRVEAGKSKLIAEPLPSDAIKNAPAFAP
jgi:alkaline phosphatase D